MAGKILGWAGALLMAAQSTGAMAAPDLASAEKLRKLDIMLMVTGLWCRHTPHDFQPDYYRFSSTHLTELNEAARALRGNLVGAYGPKGADRALDRLSVGIANGYGQGHPSLSCQQLQSEVRSLASDRKPGALLAAANRLLPESRGVQLAVRP